MDNPQSRPLDVAAAAWRIEPEYHDIWGKHHVATDGVKRAILSSLGVPASNDGELEAAIEQRTAAEWTRLLPATLVAGERPRPLRIPLNAPMDAESAVLRVHRENGGQESIDLRLRDWPVTHSTRIGERGFVRRSVTLPDLPLGYHDVEVTIGEAHGRMRLIVAPDRAYLPPLLAGGRKCDGVALSLYGVRSQRNWGCGDFTDLFHIIDWVADDVGGDFVALNPLHAIENRQPYNVSPYLPNSAFQRNPLYLDIEKIEEFASSEGARKLLARSDVQAEIAALRASEFVEYERISALKQRFLKLLFREFTAPPGSPRYSQFRGFVEERGDFLHLFAVCCALGEWLHAENPDLWIWPDWPQQYRDPASPAVREFAETHASRVLYHKYLQWQVDMQLESAHLHARGKGLAIGLYHDLALATDKCGADLWAYRPFYASGCRVGSPPDGFAPNGQDWSFPPPNTQRHREDGYRLFIESIRANSRHGGALRIDHVMRLFHLYWIPDGMEATDGAYVQDYYEDLLRILALESVRNRVLIIGEDLGTVADNIRAELARFGILSYRLLYFEKNAAGGFRKPSEYPVKALVSATTHDLATIAGFWINRDIEARRQAGLLPDEASYRRQIAERARDKQLLVEVLHELGYLPSWFPHSASDTPELTGELHNAIIGFLVNTPSMLMALNQEDLTKETEQQNLPASTWQYPNWRRKMKYSVEDLRTLKSARDFTEMFRNWLAKSGRLNPRP